MIRAFLAGCAVGAAGGTLAGIGIVLWSAFGLRVPEEAPTRPTRAAREHDPEFWADCAEGRCPHSLDPDPLDATGDAAP